MSREVLIFKMEEKTTKNGNAYKFYLSTVKDKNKFNNKNRISFP